MSAADIPSGDEGNPELNELLSLVQHYAFRCLQLQQKLKTYEEIGQVPTLRDLQEEQKAWVKHNFDREGVRFDRARGLLLGAFEELGKLAHSHLKQHQGIRGAEAMHELDAKDAVADCVIFLADYCSARGFDMHDIVHDTWAKVKKRDWKKDKRTAGMNLDVVDDDGEKESAGWDAS